MLFLVSYDISDNRLRYRTVRVLERFGRRVQKSVFECHLEESHRLQLMTALESLRLGDADSIRIYLPDMRSAESIQVFGVDHGGTPPPGWVL